MVISSSWLAARLENQLAIDRLGEARVGDGGGKAARGEIVGRLQRFGEARPQRKDGDPRSLAQHAPLADG